MKFEEKLMKLRKEKAWSQEELAEKLNVTRQTISKWELGQTVPDMYNLTKIAEVFGTTVSELYYEKENTEDVNNLTEKDNKGTNKIIIIVIVAILAFILILVGIGAMVKGKIFNIFGNILETSKEKQNYASGLFNDVYEQANNTIGNIMQQMFNSDLEHYYGEVRGTSVKNLIDDIAKSNGENPNKVITLKYNDIETSNTQEIRNVKDKINSDKVYEVSYEYDGEGYINKAIISKEKLSETAINSFNRTFKNLYYGSKDGFFMSQFIDEVIKSNEENPDHIITVNYNGVETSNPNELRNMKKQFENRTTYEIFYEYDANGLINKANVTR